MKKFGKKGIVAVASLIAALSVSAIVPAVANAGGDTTTLPKGFESESVEIKGSNEALSKWMFFFNGDKDAEGKVRGTVYDSENLHVSATTEGRTGNALHLKRDKADGELVMYSYAFDVKPDQNYVIGAFVKSLCAQTADNKVYFKIKEQSANGGVVGDEFAVQHSVDGRRDDWTETTFSYKTSASAKTLILKICADGVGDFYVDDITFKASNAATNTALYRMQGIGKVANGASDDVGEAGKDNFEVLTSANILTDSSDGDNASLLLNEGEIYKTNFSALDSTKKYRLSFKYKMLEAGSENRLSIRMNHCDIGSTSNKFYAGVSGGNADEWSAYSLDFAPEGDSTFGIAIQAYAKYAIDELKITCMEESDNMQYIVNGSFSGAYMEGYVFGDNFNVAKQADGTPVFVAGNGSFDNTFGARGYFTIPAANLTEGKEYTLSYDYRFNGADWVNCVIAYYNGAEFANFTGVSKEWTNKTYTFVAGAKNEFKFYGPSYYYWATYYRNIQIKDSDGNRYDINSGLVAPEVVLGENEFPYGTFEGDVNYVAEDWTFEGNANVFGLTFDTRWEPGAKPDWKLCLYGTEETPAIAISKEIAVSKRTLMVGCKIYTGNVKFSVIAGDQEIATDENGFIELPEGTTTVRIKCTATEYVAFKYLMLGTHTHATPEEGATTTEAATCTKIGGTFYYCADCEKNVYIEKIPMLAHDLEHVHEDATCRDGVDKDVCKLCKQEFNVKILPATGEHDYKTEIIKDATCTASGMKQDVCKVCGSKGNISVIPKKAHDYKDGKCTVCGAEDPDYEPTSEPTSESTDEPTSGSTSEEPASGSESEKPSESKGSGTSAGKKGCGSNVYGGAMALGTLAAAAVVMIKRKKED